VELTTEDQKQAAAKAAADLVREGETVGLGSGTTAAYLLEALAQRVRNGLHIVGVPTSEETGRAAAALRIRVASLEQYPRLDVDIDGADEIDPHLDLVKGHGGAHLREKIVAVASQRMIVIADESKIVAHLGEHMPLPVEVVPFGLEVTRTALLRLGAQPLLRGGENPFRTDNGNVIFDCRFSGDLSPQDLATQIKLLPGVVEHGYFLGIATAALIGCSDGSVQRLERSG
jgi:ribose 5-phosphate isomerase A